MSKGVLGRGLSQKMFNREGVSFTENYLKVPIDAIRPNPDQPRKTFSESSLKSLSESIKSKGILNPITVVKDGDSFIIVSGERRFKAAMKAGLKEVDVKVIAADKKEVFEISILENVQREDLNVIELAQSLKMLAEEYDYSQNEMAQLIGYSKGQVSNILRMLKLPQSVQQRIINGEINYGLARTILSLENQELQEELAQQIEDQNLTVREAEQQVKELKKTQKKEKDETETKEKQKQEDPNAIFYKDIEDQLSQRLDTNVSVKHRSPNKGRIEINYSSPEQLKTIIEVLGVEL